MWEIPEEVGPQWSARRSLADSLRELLERCVRTEADTEALQAAQALVVQATELLPMGPTAADAFRDLSYFEAPGEWIDRGALMGRCNPVAPPMDIHTEDGHSASTVVLGERHVGAPGIAHGGILAACFDQLCGHCAVFSGHPGLTVGLDIRYKKPAHVHVPLDFEAKITSVRKRLVTVEGSCTWKGQLVGSCKAVFMVLDSAQGEALFLGGD
jgi:acyl-coenzyme A thioesterase PaaI-like protein